MRVKFYLYMKVMYVFIGSFTRTIGFDSCYEYNKTPDDRII